MLLKAAHDRLKRRVTEIEEKLVSAAVISQAGPQTVAGQLPTFDAISGSLSLRSLHRPRVFRLRRASGGCAASRDPK